MARPATVFARSADKVDVWFAKTKTETASGLNLAFSKEQQERVSSMSEAVRDLFDRWERVWHEGQYDLIPSCVGSHYIRHDEKGDRTVTREAYAAELAAIHRERPGTRVVVYDHSFTDDRAWFRFSFVWPDPATGEPRSRAGMQSYRIEGGKLAETWITLLPLATAWTDAAAQERWTVKRPV